MDEDIPAGSPSSASRVMFGQIMDVWVVPELERRISVGSIDPQVELRAVQVVFPPAGDATVRLNEEVKGIAQLRTTSGIEAGELLRESDIAEYTDVQLMEQDKDCGHITMLRHRDEWFIKFDFLYNKGRSRGAHATGMEFLRAAEGALTRGHLRVFVENLLHAGELGARGRLLSTPGNPVFEGTRIKRNSHEHIPSQLERYEQLVPKEQRLARVLRKLNELRRSGTYGEDSFALERAEAQAMFDIIRDGFGFGDPEDPQH